MTSHNIHRSWSGIYSRVDRHFSRCCVAIAQWINDIPNSETVGYEREVFFIAFDQAK